MSRGNRAPERSKSDGGVKKAVEDLLEAERIPYFRMNAGDRFGSYKGKTWRIRGHAEGTADFLVCPNLPPWGTTVCDFEVIGDIPAYLWVETKAPGKKPTNEQNQFARNMQARGHYWICVDDAQQLIDWLKKMKAR